MIPRVSVIIPSYNRAHLIDEAIQSVLNQTYTDFELIVVDDGSTDNTEDVVYSITDQRIVYIKQSNRGVSAARNKGLQLARGEFVAFLDSDDLFLPSRLSLQLAKMVEDPECGLLYSKYYVTYSDRSAKNLAGKCIPQLGFRELLSGQAFHWSTVLIRRAWIDRVGNFDEKFKTGEEWDLTLRLALAGCKMVGIPLPLIEVRIQPVSLTREVLNFRETETNVLEKIFRDPLFPEDLRNIQNIARAYQLIRVAGLAYLEHQPEKGQNLFNCALDLVYQTNSKNDLENLIDRFVGSMVGFSLDQPISLLMQVSNHLPGGVFLSRKIKRRIWGKYYLDAAFQAYQSSQMNKCKKYSFQAIRNSPHLIKNRGLISIIIRTTVGDWPSILINRIRIFLGELFKGLSFM